MSQRTHPPTNPLPAPADFDATASIEGYDPGMRLPVLWALAYHRALAAGMTDKYAVAYAVEVTKRG
jgi:hypothetical protein